MPSITTTAHSEESGSVQSGFMSLFDFTFGNDSFSLVTMVIKPPVLRTVA